MKLSRKVIAGISAAAAIVVAGTVAGCKSDDEDPYQLINVSGDNATIDASNDGTAEDTGDGKVATSTTYVRGFRTPKTTGWKAAVYKLTINSESKGGVLGFVFDEEVKEGTNGQENEYSFYLLGVKATDNTPSVYLSRFNNVKQSGLSGDGTSFGDEYTMVDSGQTTAPTGGSKWYCQLGNSFKYISGEANLYVVVKQPSETAGYSFGLFATEKDATDWYNGNAADAKTGTTPASELSSLNAANKNSGTNKTFVEQYSVTTGGAATYTPSITDFNVEYPKTAYRDKQVGFYAMIPRGGKLKGGWTKIDNKLADVAVEE